MTGPHDAAPASMTLEDFADQLGLLMARTMDLDPQQLLDELEIQCEGLRNTIAQRQREPGEQD